MMKQMKRFNGDAFDPFLKTLDENWVLKSIGKLKGDQVTNE